MARNPQRSITIKIIKKNQLASLKHHFFLDLISIY